jgi:hypothetical protein
LQTQKKKQMLAGWILDGGVCGKNFKSWMHEVSVKKTSGLFEDWLTQSEATTKYGEVQLKSMVEAGTIQVRRLASDPRFFEFRALSQKNSTVVTGAKTTSCQGDKKAISRDDMIAFSKVDPFNVTAQDFDLDDFASGLTSGSSKDKQVQDDLAKALKIKVTLPSKPDKKAKADPLEVMSQISPGESKDAIKKKLVHFKAQLMSESSTMEKIALDLKSQKCTKESNQAMKSFDALEKLGSKMAGLIKQSNPKKEDQKKLLLESYKEIMASKKVKTVLQKLLPKKSKNKKEAAKDDEEPEEEEDADDAE